MSKIMFETERLYLKKVSLKDAPFFLNLWNSPNWIELVGDRHIRTLDQAKKTIQSILLSCYKNNTYGMYKMVLKKNSKTIGICGFSKRLNLEHPDVGFAVLPEYERKGYSFETAKAVMFYGKTTLGLKKIFGLTFEKNIGSNKLLQKIGLKKIGLSNSDTSGAQFLLYSNLA